MSLLEQARETINRVDREMARLFEERMNAVRLVAEYKIKNGLQVLDPEREKQVIERNSALIGDSELRSYYISFLNESMAISRKFQHRLMEGRRIAYSGVPGAFAHIAASRIFPDAVCVPHGNFASAYKSVLESDCDCAVLPIENSVNGDVTQVMDMAYSGNLYISGVYELGVEHCLLGLPGAEMKDIKTVVSHEQALGQCASYLSGKPWNTKTAVNTAIAAKEAAEAGDISVAVIASAETAELYGLKVLERKINEGSQNITRFAVFTREPTVPATHNNRFIMFFTVKNEAGSLMKAVEAIGKNGFNLRALKSRPTKETNWEYYFYAEGEGTIADKSGRRMIEDLTEVCGKIKIIASFDRDIII